MAGRRRRGELWDLDVPLESFTDVPSLSSIREWTGRELSNAAGRGCEQWVMIP
jgi:hypothetical protein